MDAGSTAPRDERAAGRWMGVLILFILAAGVAMTVRALPKVTA